MDDESCSQHEEFFALLSSEILKYEEKVQKMSVLQKTMQKYRYKCYRNHWRKAVRDTLLKRKLQKLQKLQNKAAKGH